MLLRPTLCHTCSMQLPSFTQTYSSKGWWIRACSSLMCSETPSEGGKFAPLPVEALGGCLVPWKAGSALTPLSTKLLCHISQALPIGEKHQLSPEGVRTSAPHTCKSHFLLRGVGNLCKEQPLLQTAEITSKSHVETCRASKEPHAPYQQCCMLPAFKGYRVWKAIFQPLTAFVLRTESLLL